MVFPGTELLQYLSIDRKIYYETLQWTQFKYNLSYKGATSEQ